MAGGPVVATPQLLPGGFARVLAMSLAVLGMSASTSDDAGGMVDAGANSSVMGIQGPHATWQSAFSRLMPASLLVQRQQAAAQLRSAHRNPNEADGSNSEVGTQAADSSAQASTIQRPNAGLAPVNITFGIQLQELIGVNIKAGHWTGDFIITLSWVDNRAPAAAGAVDSNVVELSLDSARSKIWLPNVGITDRDFSSSELIFGAVRVDNNAHVTKTERVRVSVKNIFDAVAFPFDEHSLQVRIASQTYMASDLVLVPSANLTNFSTASGETGWLQSGHHLSSFHEVDGPLSKSRGQLKVTVERDRDSMTKHFLFPQVLLLCLAIISFLYPLMPNFLVPKFLTCLVASFAQLFVLFSAVQFVPVRGWSWVQLHGEMCLLVSFSALVLHMMVERVAMHKQLLDLAHTMQNETRAIIGAFVVVGYVSILMVQGKSSVRTLSNAEQFLFVGYTVALMAFLASNQQRVLSALASFERPLVSDDDEEDFGGGGGRRRQGFFAQFQGRREGRRQVKERPWGHRKPKAGASPSPSAMTSDSEPHTGVDVSAS